MQSFAAQIIPLEKVNRNKWDAVVQENDNGLIYTSYDYLQILCSQCLAVIINDYEAVMALPVKKKFGISYLYTPPFVQQLGVIGNMNAAHYAPLLQLLQKHFRYGDVLFNFQNSFIEREQSITLKNNCIIHLQDDYPLIKNKYHPSVSYSLHKAEKAGCLYVSSNDIEEAIGLYQSYNKEKLTHVSNKDFDNLTELCKTLSLQGNIIVRKIINQQHEVLSIVLLLKDNKRYYNLINYTSLSGRQTDANYFLYDNLFKELANQKMLFDFEGSNIEGIKSFYEKFGAVNQPYFHWHYNRLPFPLNIMKP